MKDDALSEAKVALEEAIKQCRRAGMDDHDIKKYAANYITATKD